MLRSSRTRTIFLAGALILLSPAFGQSHEHFAALPLPKPRAYLKFGVEKNFVLPKGIKLPKHLDLSRHFAAPGDQGKYASCTAWAIGYGMMTYHHNEANGIVPDKSLATDPADVYSPAYLYTMVKRYAQPDSSDAPCMSGVDVEATLTVAVEWGDPLMTHFKQRRKQLWCRDTIPPSVMDIALEHKLRTPVALYHDRLHGAGALEIPFDPVQWKYHLFKHDPILASIFVDCAFIDGGDGKRAKGKPFVWDCGDCSGDKCSSGHVLICCGYDDADSTFLFYNSFGSAWGDAGFCRIDYGSLYAICLQAYIFTGEKNEIIEPPSFALRAPSSLTDTTVNGKLKVGQCQELDHVRIGLAHHDRRAKREVVELLDPVSGKEIHSLLLEDGLPRAVVVQDKMWIIRCEESSWLGQYFGDKARVIVEVDNDDDEILQERYERHLARFRNR